VGHEDGLPVAGLYLQDVHILGISAFYHDSAAALVRDGEIMAAAQEERFTRIKHDSGFPSNAVAYCLREAGIEAQDLDHVAFYDKPLLKFDRILETYLAHAPRGLLSFVKALPLWLNQKLHLPREMDAGLGGQFRGRYVFPEHHESHAASAFFPSPFQEAAILTMDGVGEWATASWGTGSGHSLELSHEIRFPHSLGLLYSAFTFFTGFKVNSGEYKLMGLAPYGSPIYADLIREHLIDIKDDGSFRLNLEYFDYCAGLKMTSSKMDELFGGPPRKSEDAITKREMDLAASIQEVTEEVVLKAGRHIAVQTGMKNLVMAGGVALNCVSNGKLLRDGCFDNIWVQPASGDAGGALGAALFVWHQLLGNSRRVDGTHDLQFGSLLGPRFEANEIKAFLDRIGAVYEYIPDEEMLLDEVVRALSDERVVGHLYGRMEFGPRALGGRSILGDPRSRSMQSTMNQKIKFRESFRPFAPSVLREHVHEWFETREGEDSPYMLLVAPVRESKRRATIERVPDDENLFDWVNEVRSDVPAITHVDHSARLQTVDVQRHGRYHRLLSRFRDVSGCPIVINTSFNIRGEPIVCSPEDAYRCFMGCNMDTLVLEDFILHKERQPAENRTDEGDYKAQFALD
jgi:carbamoyltransferase